VAVLIALHVQLPNDTPRFEARGAIAAYPNSASMNSPDTEDVDGDALGSVLPASEVRLPWRDERMASWLIAGLIGGHAQAIILGVVGFLVRDRLGLHDRPWEAVQASGSVMLIGAMATLLAQWGLIPMLSLAARSSVLLGAILALLGTILTGVSHDFYGISNAHLFSGLTIDFNDLVLG
jgi:hypothetical protein